MNSVTALVRVPALRTRTVVTVLLMGLAFALTHVPVPGVHNDVVEQCSAAGVDGVLAVANFLGGGALAKLTFGAVGVMPVITASIILLLAARLSSRVSAMVHARSARFHVTVAVIATSLSVGQAVASVTAAQRPGGLLKGCPVPVIDPGFGPGALAIGCILAGTAALVALGTAVTKFGIGNGLSFIIGLGVVSVLPMELVRVWAHGGPGLAITAAALLVVVLAGLIYMNRRTVGLDVTLDWRDDSHPVRRLSLPMPLNPAGVMPLILATTLVSGPQVLDLLTPGAGWPRALASAVSAPASHWHWVAVAASTVLLTFYWTIVSWDAEQMAGKLAENQVSVVGAEGDPGRAAAVVDRTLLRATLVTAPVLAVLAVLPSVAVALLGTTTRFPLGGSSLLVMVAIGADTVKRIRADIAEATAPASGDGPGEAPLDTSDEALAVALVGLGKVHGRLV